MFIEGCEFDDVLIFISAMLDSVLSAAFILAHIIIIIFTIVIISAFYGCQTKLFINTTIVSI